MGIRVQGIDFTRSVPFLMAVADHQVRGGALRMEHLSEAVSGSSTARRPASRPPSAGDEFLARLEHAIAASHGYFRRAQHESGYWHRPLEANATMDAQYVMFMHFMGRVDAERQRRVAAHLLATQLPDGGWSLYPDAEGHLSNTIEAYFALKLAGVPPAHAALEKARAFVLARGGLAKAGVFTRIFLAYFGQFPWDGVPAMPVELMLLPRWSPINIYEMSSWARGTVVPLTVLLALRPSIAIAPEQGVAELWLRAPVRDDYAFAADPRPLTWRNFFLALDRVLKAVGRSPVKPLRRRALATAGRWILDHQDRNGGWGGIQPAMVNSVMALRVLGYGDDHPAVQKGIQAIEDFMIEEGGQLFFQPCVSPTWDTALAAKAMLESGMPPDDPALVRAGEWLLDNQIFERGDWQIKNPHLEPGGWAFEFANDWYPDTDDTAVILMVLQRIALPDARRQARAIRRGLNWTLGMQSRCGGWGAFDTDNTRQLFNRIPFADMEAMLDEPTADLTGRHLELMGEYGYDLEMRPARRALEFVRRTQEVGGSWWGRWGVNHIYGTWSVLAGLRAIGEDLERPYVRRAVRWLKEHQNPDGGWGETCDSYGDATLAGTGPSTPSQTAWAILGLLAGEDEISPELVRGITHLATTQRPDGTWDERHFTGTGFPRHFYLRYYMYRNYFPLMALGRFRARAAARGV
jgi:squalene-hopene/tetraprenyl-beta-curcumene cyclase